jgi:hypothetical protein
MESKSALKKNAKVFFPLSSVKIPQIKRQILRIVKIYNDLDQLLMTYNDR